MNKTFVSTVSPARLATIGVAAAAVAAGLSLAHQPARHDRAAGDAGQPNHSVSASTRAAAGAALPTAQGVFIAATANYLCLAATKVYPTPAALAAAYTPPTVIAGLTASQVVAFRQQLNTDRQLSGQIKAKIATGCHPTPTTTKR